MLIFFFSVALALGMSAICSLLEATLLSFTPSQVAALEARRPRVGAIWRSFKENIEKPIAVILVVNTTAHTVGATMAGAQFEKAFGANGLLIFSVVFTYLMLQFTEILPKSLGVRYNHLVAPVIAPLLVALIRLLAPLLWLVQLVNRPFAREGEAGEDTTLQEIAALASSSPLMDPQQSRMIKAASEMENLCVRQIMTPRTRVAHLLTSQRVEEVFAILRDSIHTRLPLCEGSIDNVIGMVHTKDFIKFLDMQPAGSSEVTAAEGAAERRVFGMGAVDLMALKRDVLFLPDQTTLLKALREFQSARLHLAVVVDEYGATEGIVTLEDVLEEMVGDIHDEFDKRSAQLIRPEGPGFRISARCPLHELVQRVPESGINYNEEQSDTVGGYVVHLFGRLPENGDYIDSNSYRWTVASADKRRVREVILTPLAEVPDDESGAS